MSNSFTNENNFGGICKQALPIAKKGSRKMLNYSGHVLLFRCTSERTEESTRIMHVIMWVYT